MHQSRNHRFSLSGHCGALALVSLLAAGCGLMGTPPAPEDPGTTGPLSNAEERLGTTATSGAPGKATGAIPGGYPKSPLGISWVFVSINGYDSPLPGPPSQPAFIMSKQGGRMVGTTSCNAMSAVYKLDLVGGALSFSLLTNGSAMCPESQSDAEQAVIDALIATDGFRMTPGQLELTSKGSTVATLRGTAPTP